MRAKPQRHRPNKNRIAAGLSAELDRTLAAYTSAATAAGVGILALTCPASAKIVYTHVHKQLPINKTFFLDLNHDGIADFAFNNTKGTTIAGGGWDFLTIFPVKSANRIWGERTGDNGFFRYASALSAGARVGPSAQFTPGNKLMVYSWSNQGRRNPPASLCAGPWKDVTERYLGLKFTIKGKRHYGWARLNVACSNITVTATLTGYAYETIPNKPITAGKTHGSDEIGVEEANATLGAPAPHSATLGLLALGSPANAIWRRRGW
jgi:hypothetical protein